MKSQIIYLPIETKSREFYGKLLLGCFAAEQGYRVLIGSRAIMSKFIDKMPPGLYFYNAMCPHDEEVFLQIKKIGHKIVALDEEGLLYRSPEIYLKNRISKPSIDLVEKFFTWGYEQTKIVQEAIPDKYKSKIIKVGNPRIDIIDEKLWNLNNSKVNELKNEYKKYILINTNFSTANNFNYKDFYRDFYNKNGYIKSEKEEEELNILWKRQEYLFKAFKKMISLIARRYSNINIVIRPHPSESYEGWRNVISEHKNVYISKNGNVHDWIKGSLMVIHNSCTTGIESFILGKPVISFVPNDIKVKGFELANALSIEIKECKDLLSVIDRVLSGDNKLLSHSELLEKNSLLKKHIEISETFSCEKIIKEISNIKIEPTNKFSSSIVVKIWSDVNLRKIKLFIAKKFNLKKSVVYNKNKFPGISYEDIKIVLMYKSILNRFDGVECKSLTEDFLVIESNDNNK